MSERPTPETDAEIDAEMLCACYPNEYVGAEFARKLERERDEARERLRKVLKVLDDYEQAIKNPSSPFWDAFKKWFTWEAAK